MLRLNVSRDPRWLRLAEGVGVLLKPADIELMADAQEDPDYLAAVQEFRELVPEADGAAPDQAQLTRDEFRAASRVGVELAVAVAQRAVIGWEGMEDDSGAPLPEPFPEAIRAFITHPLVFAKFQTEYMAPMMELAAEGNGSRASLIGISAVARTIAQAAPDDAKTAQGT